MRRDPYDPYELNEFFIWLLNVGDDETGERNYGEVVIQIPNDHLSLHCGDDPIHDIVKSTHPEFMTHMQGPKYCQERAILSPTLEVAIKINDYVVCLLLDDENLYLSLDNTCK